MAEVRPTFPLPGLGRRRSARLTRGLALLVLCGGCGAAEPPVEVQTLDAVIAGLPDATGTPELFASIFAAGAVPSEADRPRLALLNFERVGTPIVRPDGAEAQVQVYDENGQPLGQVQWVFARENGAWKVQQAPLPEPATNRPPTSTAGT